MAAPQVEADFQVALDNGSVPKELQDALCFAGYFSCKRFLACFRDEIRLDKWLRMQLVDAQILGADVTEENWDFHPAAGDLRQVREDLLAPAQANAGSAGSKAEPSGAQAKGKAMTLSDYRALVALYFAQHSDEVKRDRAFPGMAPCGQVRQMTASNLTYMAPAEFVDRGEEERNSRATAAGKGSSAQSKKRKFTQEVTKEGQLVWVESSEPEVVKDLGGSIMRLEKFLERRGMAFVANGLGRMFSWRTYNACLVDFYFEEVVEDGLRANTVKAGVCSCVYY